MRLIRRTLAVLLCCLLLASCEVLQASTEHPMSGAGVNISDAAEIGSGTYFQDHWRFSVIRDLDDMGTTCLWVEIVPVEDFGEGFVCNWDPKQDSNVYVTDDDVYAARYTYTYGALNPNVSKVVGKLKSGLTLTAKIFTIPESLGGGSAFILPLARDAAKGLKMTAYDSTGQSVPFGIDKTQFSQKRTVAKARDGKSWFQLSSFSQPNVPGSLCLEAYVTKSLVLHDGGTFNCSWAERNPANGMSSTNVYVGGTVNNHRDKFVFGPLRGNVARVSYGNVWPLSAKVVNLPKGSAAPKAFFFTTREWTVSWLWIHAFDSSGRPVPLGY